MRHLGIRQLGCVLATAAVIAIPGAGQASEADVQSLIGQLKPRAANAPVVSRGIRRQADDTTAPSAPTPMVAPISTPAPRPHPAPGAAVVATAKPIDSDAGAHPSANIYVSFPSGSATLTPAAIATLRDLGKALTDPALAGSRFQIEGHTDTIGTRSGNQTLSERRAAAVAEFLQQEYHVSPDRLHAIGMGEDHLLIPTGEQIDEPRNRRVQIVNLDG